MRRGGEDLPADRRRVLTARVVVGNDDAIRQAAGDLAHDRPLAAVAVAAAAEHDPQPRLGVRRDRLQDRLERARRVGVVDEDLAARRRARDPLHAPGHAFEPGQRLDRGLRGKPGCDRQAERGQCVGCLEGADQRQLDPVRPAQEVEHQGLPVRRGLLGHEAQIAIGDPVGQDLDPAPRAKAAQLLEDRRVGVEHRRAARGQKLLEQAHLGGQVGRHVAVIIQMVARQVGEGRRRDLDAVEPVLVEAVARGLHDQVFHAVLGEARQTAVQLDGIGRGQRLGRAGPGRAQAERPEARRFAPLMTPDLPGEADHRGLAVGAGDRGDHLGLAPVEARRHERQTPARVVVGHQADRRLVVLERGSGRRQHGDRAVVDGVIDIAAAVLPAARQGGEQESRTDLAAVRRETANLDVCQGCRRCHFSRRVLDQIS